MLYSDLFEMITDVRKALAAGDLVVNYDNPKSLHLGYQGLTQEWEISLFDIKRLWPQRSDWTPDQVDTYSKMKTAPGRLDVVYGRVTPDAPVQEVRVDDTLRALFRSKL